MWWPFLTLSRKIALALPLSKPFCSGRLMVWCPRLCACKCLSLPQHFRSSQMQATCDHCFVHQTLRCPPPPPPPTHTHTSNDPAWGLAVIVPLLSVSPSVKPFNFALRSEWSGRSLGVFLFSLVWLWVVMAWAEMYNTFKLWVLVTLHSLLPDVVPRSLEKQY